MSEILIFRRFEIKRRAAKVSIVRLGVHIEKTSSVYGRNPMNAFKFYFRSFYQSIGIKAYKEQI